MTGELEYQQLVSLVTAWPGDTAALSSLGAWLFNAKRWPAAAACFARVVDLAPEDYRALSNYGWNLHLAGRVREAGDALRRAIEIAPGEATPRGLYSQVASSLGLADEAIAHARMAVDLEPSSALNHVALSFALMSAGRWLEGWREYEWRYQYKIPEFMTRPYRLWRGERVEHLYLEAEMGAGDTIMALRWVPEAAARADRVTMYVHSSVYALAVECTALPENVSVRPLPRALPVDVDAWSPLMSLPAALEDCGEFAPYVSVLERRLASDRKEIGIAWAGSPTHDNSHKRDCPLVNWLRLFETSGVRWHALQYGERSADIADLGLYGLVEDRAPEISSFYDTARIISGLDLVIAVDTAVAHLAGAMGKPCWMLVNESARDFRWGYERAWTPWYPSMRIFRRSLDEGWGDLMGRVGDELRRLFCTP